ncbi:MAG: helix-turn-helix transcriptional regulator [Clostridiales bacterium]|nr:helix-turn-helix transcriptional regulator [Clostridiales bacterium]
MKHNDLKELLFQDEELKNEYDALEPIYKIKSELINLRIEKGLSQKQLAELIGTKQSAISRLESGNSNPSVEFLSKIAHALGKNLHISFS